MTRQEQTLFKIAYLELKDEIQTLKTNSLWDKYIEKKNPELDIKTLEYIVLLLDEKIANMVK